MVHRMARLLAVVALISLGGCVAGVNPFVDRLQISPDSIQSPTVEAIAERNVQPQPTMAGRFEETQVIAAADGTVTHYPLWFEDPVENKDDGDGQFAITSRDFGLYFYGIGRSAVNGIALPVSAVFDPPWSLECSDGLVEDQYDAKRCPGGVPTVPELIAEDEVQPSYFSGNRRQPMINQSQAPSIPRSSGTIETIPVREM